MNYHNREVHDHIKPHHNMDSHSIHSGTRRKAERMDAVIVLAFILFFVWACVNGQETLTALFQLINPLK